MKQRQMEHVFTWDREKNVENAAKHGIPFEIARLAFDDPLAISLLDQDSVGEERFKLIGMIGTTLHIFVAYTYRGDTVRIISARRATKSERRQYEKINRQRS